MYLFLVIMSGVCLAFQIPELQSWATWDASAIVSGQWWRILTGNLTHTNAMHLIMNIAGLWVITHLFKPTAKHVAFVLLCCSAVVGIALLATEMQRYVGLSGVLHGLFGYFALREALEGRKSSWLLVGGLVAKVAWEQSYGASTSTSAMINARVAIEAHLVGAHGGTLLALLTLSVQKITASDNESHE